MLKYPFSMLHFTESQRFGKRFLHPFSLCLMHSTDTRYQQLLDWLRIDLGRPVESIAPASSDASFRRYFRIHSEGQSHIVMDAPPPRENVRPFVAVAELLRNAGVQTPEIHAVDAERGFVLLGDFGSRIYLDELDEQTAESLYGDAMVSLLALQQGVNAAAVDLPAYDERLLRTELGIFREWFLEKWLALELSAGDAAMIEQVWATLVDSALEQPRVCVHRDYHSRNLMVTDEASPGVLDFQDAVLGPITYDLASLLRDCYVAWPADRVYRWMESYRQALLEAKLLEESNAGQFRRWFDLMGMQRHLKAAGIFSRLNLRDAKPGYLRDIPRTLGYVMEAGRNYPELAGFVSFLEQRVVPRLTAEVPS